MKQEILSDDENEIEHYQKMKIWKIFGRNINNSERRKKEENALNISNQKSGKSLLKKRSSYELTIRFIYFHSYRKIIIKVGISIFLNILKI